MSAFPQRKPRVPKTLAVVYQHGSSFVKAYAKDISTGGLFISTENPLNQGDKFFLKLQLPGLSDPMNLKCEVAWAGKQGVETDAGSIGMGVKFLEMTKEIKEILKPYIKTIEKLGFKTLEMSEKDNLILKQYLKTIEEGVDSG